jgi:hypothetical protein
MKKSLSVFAASLALSLTMFGLAVSRNKQDLGTLQITLFTIGGDKDEDTTFDIRLVCLRAGTSDPIVLSEKRGLGAEKYEVNSSHTVYLGLPPDFQFMPGDRLEASLRVNAVGRDTWRFKYRVDLVFPMSGITTLSKGERPDPVGATSGSSGNKRDFLIFASPPFPTSTPTPTPLPTRTPTPLPTVTPRPTVHPSRFPTPAPTATPLTSPTQTPTPVPTSQDEAALIEAARKTFKVGQISFIPPTEMEVGKTETFEVRLTQLPPEKASQEVLTKGLPGSGKARVESLKVGCNMRVTLTAEEEDFKISPITTNEVRWLDPEAPFEPWTWSVTPKKSGGEQKIHITVEARLNLKDIGERSLYVKTYDHTIKVKVTPRAVLEWAIRNWEWIAGTLVIPLVGWLWQLYSKRKEGTNKNTARRKRK